MKGFLSILRFILPYKGTVLFGFISLILTSASALAFPYLVGKLLDVASEKTDNMFTSILDVGVALAVFLLLHSLFIFIRIQCFSKVSALSLADLRMSIYRKAIWLPMLFFDKHRIGEVLSRISSDVSTLQETFSSTIAQLLRDSLELILALIIIFYLTPKLAIFMVITLPVLVILASLFGKYIRKLSTKTQNEIASSNIIVEETIQAIGVVKSFTNERLEQSRYHKSIRKIVRTSLKIAKFQGSFASFTIIALFGGISIILLYGALLVQNGEISIGELTSFVLYSVYIQGSIENLVENYGQIQKSIGASEEIFNILDQPDEENNFNTNYKFSGAISYENLEFSYPTRPDILVLKSISFAIKPGEHVALIGQSGVGKSTIISLLMRFYLVTHGSIKVDGKNINSYDLSGYRANIGIVPQEVILFGGSILENIAYGKPNSTYVEIYEASAKANALEFIEGFPDKFDTVVGDRGVKLSGGQRQRIAIARAILKNPSILILDEATNSLDVKSEMLVQEALEKLMKNRTTIVIAHRLRTIRNVDRILVVEDGQISESGSHENLANLKSGIYRELLNTE